MNQKPISMRINHGVNWSVDQEVMCSGLSKNRILNLGAQLYVDLQDRRREFKIHQDPVVRSKILRGFLAVWFPEAL